MISPTIDRTKVRCQERRCGWHGNDPEMLRAGNPFDADDEILACPKCKSVVGSIESACDEPDCWEAVSCGTPIPGGYRRTCSKHRPE